MLSSYREAIIVVRGLHAWTCASGAGHCTMLWGSVHCYARMLFARGCILRQKHAGIIGSNRRPVSTGCRPAAAGLVANTSMPEALAALLPADTRGDFAKLQAALDQNEIDQLQVQPHQLTVLHEDIGWTL